MFSWSIDHAKFLSDMTQFWAFINVNGIFGGLMNIVCAVLIYNTVKHMADDDKDIDTSDPDMEMGTDE